MSNQRIIFNVSSLPGCLADKLARATALSFSAIEVGNNDITSTEQSLQENVSVLAEHDLKVAAFHELKDFLGHSSRLMDYKMALAKSNLQLMGQVGADLLVVTPALQNYSDFDLSSLAQELRALAVLATVRAVRIGFKPLPWSQAVNSYSQSLAILKQANNSNLSLVIDSAILQEYSPQALQELLDALPLTSISLVQLSVVEEGMCQQSVRYLPTSQNSPVVIKQLIEMLEQRGYRGYYSLHADAQAYQQYAESALNTEIGDSFSYISELLNQTNFR